MRSILEDSLGQSLAGDAGLVELDAAVKGTCYLEATSPEVLHPRVKRHLGCSTRTLSQAYANLKRSGLSRS